MCGFSTVVGDDGKEPDFYLGLASFKEASLNQGMNLEMSCCSLLTEGYGATRSKTVETLSPEDSLRERFTLFDLE
jgi:hypothetical protein